jgi:hypothetical protein
LKSLADLHELPEEGVVGFDENTEHPDGFRRSIHTEAGRLGDAGERLDFMPECGSWPAAPVGSPAASKFTMTFRNGVAS